MRRREFNLACQINHISGTFQRNAKSPGAGKVPHSEISNLKFEIANHKPRITNQEAAQLTEQKPVITGQNSSPAPSHCPFPTGYSRPFQATLPRAYRHSEFSSIAA